MAEKTNISNPLQGMIQDVSPMMMKETQYPYALNAAVESNSQDGNFVAIQNDGSNIYATAFPAGYKVIGKMPVHEQNRTIYFLVGETDSIIGETLDCNYDDNQTDRAGVSTCGDCVFPIEREQTPLELQTTSPYCPFHSIVQHACLDFHIDSPVRARYKITDCGLNIYFTDNRNQRRFMYFDYTNGSSRDLLKLQDRFKVVSGVDIVNCNLPVYTNELDCNKIKYHPSFEVPCIKSVDVIAGGELRAGTVQVLAAYADVNGNELTEYFHSTNPTPIFTKVVAFETNYKTDKAIKITLENLDQTFLYTHYNIIVAETVDNFTEFKRVGTFPVTQSNVVYTGNDENLTRVDASDIFFRKLYYNKAANITSANGFLFFSNLTESAKPNLQRPTLDVKLFWQTVAIPEHVYVDPKNNAKFRGHQRDEVYPYGLEYLTTDGEVLGTYHIPGPSKKYLLDTYDLNVDTIVDNNDVIVHDDCNECCSEDAPPPPDPETAITGSIVFSCPDKGCSQEGVTNLQITFAAPTPVAFKLHLGFITESTVGKKAWGYDIFTVPSDVALSSYSSTPGVPYEVNIPAGVTSINIPSIIWQSGHVGDSRGGAGWVCHSCLFPIRDVFIKSISSPGIQTVFTTPQAIVMHSLDEPIVITPPDDPEDEEDDCTNCPNHLWQVYNTGLVVGSPHEVLAHCDDDKVWEWGEFAYWESINRYPNDPVMWGPLCGKPIRHHKFPDSLVTHIHDGKDQDRAFNEKNIVFPIGVRIDHQSVINALDKAVVDGVISATDRARIASYRLVRGNRVGNKSIVAKGLLYDMWHYDKNDKRYYYANYPYNDLRNDPFISNDEDTYEGGNNSSPIPNVFSATGRYTFHSPDVHFFNPSLGSELKLETVEYGFSEGFFNHCEEEAKQKFLSTAATTLAFAAGIAAALSATEEKECITYTLTADIKTTSEVTGETPVGVVTGGGGSLAGGTGVISPNTTTITNSAFNADGTAKTETKNPYNETDFNFHAFDRRTGSNLLTPEQKISSMEKTTCKGTPYQLLSPLSGSTVGTFLQQAIYRGVLGLKEMQIMMDLIKALIPLKNFAVQYNSVAKYNDYKTVANTGNKIRKLQRSAYLEPIIQVVDEEIDAVAHTFTTTIINNWKRERSVYLRVPEDKKFPNPSVLDDSRCTMDEHGLTQSDLGKRVYRHASSYYASVKNYVSDQYGRLTDIEYLPTGCCAYQLDTTYGISQTGVFGGDTFITRFALKRKLPFFLQSRFKMNAESDVLYSELGNVGFPNFYCNSEQPLMERISGNTFGGDLLSSVVDILGVANSRLDVKKQKFFYQSGFIHLYSYGIPYFFAESDINTDYRIAHNNTEKDFYPHQGDLDFWLQEKNVPIAEDNYYLYNKTYSKQNREAFVGRQVTEVPKECNLVHPASVIQSEEDARDSKVDKWLVFKANNREDFDASNGRIIGLDGIENDKVLVRFENGAQIFGAYDTLNTDSGSVQVGNGGVFKSRPKEFSKTSLGHSGSQHVDLLLTEHGHIWVDAKRGEIFNLASGASGMDELGKDGMKNWFKENLPFQVLRDFPNFPLTDIDNNYKGIGLHLSYDKRFNRIFITKLDYRRLRSDVQYDPVEKVFYTGTTERTIIELTNTTYFASKCWTISYNFLTKSWVSFHSFVPNFYVDHVEYMQSGLNGDVSTVWSHGLTNKSFQVYYGKLAPFAVETMSSPLLSNNTLHSVTYTTDVVRYHNEFDTFYNRFVTFNKAIVYNDQQCSGELNLHVRDENNLAQSLQYPKVEFDAHHILVTNNQGQWTFNQFYDTVATQTNNTPFYKNKPNNADKELNLKALNYYKPDVFRDKIRGRQTRVRLINDMYSNYQFTLHLVEQQKH